MQPPLDELWQVVKSIPEGKVASYGEVGQALQNPTTGYIVGRWMARCPQGVPWWRVVAKTGGFPVGKRDPWLAKTQEQLLTEEGVSVTEGTVDMVRYSICL